MFFMGTDFRELKAPSFWYDILHVADVPGHFEHAHKDKRFKQMLNIIEAKADGDGQYISESIWTAWKDWDFGQKRVPEGLDVFCSTSLEKSLCNGRKLFARSNLKRISDIVIGFLETIRDNLGIRRIQ